MNNVNYSVKIINKFTNSEAKLLHTLGLGNTSDGVRWLLKNVSPEKLKRRVQENKLNNDKKLKGQSEDCPIQEEDY